MRGSQKNTRKLTPTHLAIHKINGRLTWVGALVPDGEGNADGSSVMQGVAMVPADQPMNGGDIAMGDTMSIALNNYETMLSASGNTKPGEDATQTIVKNASVDRVSQPMNEGGTTVYYFTVKGDIHSYRMAVVPTAKGADLERPFIQTGIKITFGFVDNGSGRRDVLSYDDLSLQLS